VKRFKELSKTKIPSFLKTYIHEKKVASRNNFFLFKKFLEKSQVLALAEKKKRVHWYFFRKEKTGERLTVRLYKGFFSDLKNSKTNFCYNQICKKLIGND